MFLNGFYKESSQIQNKNEVKPYYYVHFYKILPCPKNNPERGGGGGKFIMKNDDSR